MKTGTVCNVIGTGLLVAALVIHIVCFTTPYYSGADFSKLKKDMRGKDLSEQDRQQILSLIEADITIHFGLWQVCFTSQSSPDGECRLWLSDEDDHTLDPGFWLKGAQGLAIMGAVVLGKSAFGTILNLVVESRGDRQRLLPFIICGFCCAGGFFTFVGDMIIAANYQTFKDMPSGQPLSDAVKDLIGDEFSFGWGFGLDLFSVLLACIGGILHLVARRFNGSGFDIAGSRLV